MSDAAETKAAPATGGWLFLGVALGAGIVGCCWALSLRQIHETPAPVINEPPVVCNCGTVVCGDADTDGELWERLP
jgi:hypothetical protein